VSNSMAKGLTKMQMGALALGSLLMVGAAVPAAAQGLSGATTATAVTATQVSFDASQYALPADLSFVADANADQGQRPGVGAPMHQVGSKQAMFMVQGGLLFCCSNTGFDVGVGASIKPMKDNDKFEVGGDVNFGRLYAVNALYISVSGQYDMHMQNSKAVPFVGGGLGVTHVTGATNTNPELLAGVDWETGGGKALRAQVRFIFTPGSTTTALLIGMAF